MKPASPFYITLWNFKIGGIQKHAILLANHLVSLDRKVCILYSSKEGDLLELLDDRVVLTPLKIPNTNAPFQLFQLYKKLKALIPAGAVVLANGPNNFRQLARLNALFGRWRMLYVLHNDLTIQKHWAVAFKKMELRWICNAKNLQVIALTQAQKRKHEDELGIRNIEVIPNFVEFNHRHIKKPKQQQLKGFAMGRYAHEKGYDVLLDAMSFVDEEVEVDVYGYGEKIRQELIRAAEEKGLLNIHFLPSVTNVFEILMEYDYFILPSRYETFGIAAIEALSCGLPVVTTDCDGPSEIINPTNGIIVRKEDPQDLARGINKMHRALQQGKYTADEVRATAAQYSVEEVSKRYFKVL